MKTKTILLSVFAALILYTLNSCSPKTKKIKIDNSKFLNIDGGLGIRSTGYGDNEFVAINYNLLWDVEVAMNGVDFGVIEGGSISEVFDVPDANNLKIEKFNILKNDAGLSVYYINYNNEKQYVDFNDNKIMAIEDMQKCEKDMKVMEDKFKLVEQAGGLLNTDWTWDVSYGENGNSIWNKQKEEEAKKKK